MTTPLDPAFDDAPTVILPVRERMDLVKVRVEFGALTHIGKVRSNNEDQYLIVRGTKALDVLGTSLPPEQSPHILSREGYFMMVADGMGGGPAGEVASALVVTETVKHLLETAKWFFRLDDPDEAERIRLLREALQRMDDRLIKEGEHDPAVAGMGTTLTGVSIVGADVFIVHVGDCRAYLWRDGQLEQLTRDDTRAQELVERGLLRPEDVRTHRLRHHLTNVIGGRRGVEGEMVKFRLLSGDRILLCTDGLHGPVPDPRIAEVLSRHSNPVQATQALIEAALSEGGPDNITVIVAACLLEE